MVMEHNTAYTFGDTLKSRQNFPQKHGGNITGSIQEER